MAVRIRLRRMGSSKRPFYRIVVAEARMPRDGRFIDTIGYYNPVVDPAEIKVDQEKVYKWLRHGAQPTETVRSLLRKTGIWRKWGLLKRGVDISQLEEVQPVPPQEVKLEEIPPHETLHQEMNQESDAPVKGEITEMDVERRDELTVPELTEVKTPTQEAKKRSKTRKGKTMDTDTSEKKAPEAQGTDEAS